jgi:hypothetical protein
MLRSAWTGGNNYHLNADEKYDGLRVRYASHRDDLETAVTKALRGQELLYALRAFDADESIADALRTCHDRAAEAFEGIEPYLREHRHDERFDVDYVREAEGAFRSGYEHSRAFRASFGEPVSSKLVKLLREDAAANPLPFEEYAELLDVIKDVFVGWSPTRLSVVEDHEKAEGPGALEALWPLVEGYATWDPIDDADLLNEYRRLLTDRPWEQCNCRICRTHGIEVVIFRGNNRNRRRGFHNTRRFYDQFEQELPKILVLTQASSSLMGRGTIEEYLRGDRPDFWKVVHDLPVAEIGALSATGVHEWWADQPSTVSFVPTEMAETLIRAGERYRDVFVDGRHWSLDGDIEERLDNVDCRLHVCEDLSGLRNGVLDRLGYEASFLPPLVVQSGLADY